MAASVGLMNYLPDEVVEHIFIHLDGQSLITTLKVCRRWERIALYSKKNKKSLWYDICRKELSEYSLHTIRKQLDESALKNTQCDYWYRVYATATVWRHVDKMKISESHFHVENTITCASVLGAIITTGHPDCELNIWHASAGHILKRRPGSKADSLHRIHSIYLVKNSYNEKVYIRRSSSSQEGTTDGKNHVDEPEYNDKIGSYHIYYVSGGKVHRAVFRASHSECKMSDLGFGPFTRTFIRGDLMICWSDLDTQPLYVIKICEKGIREHYTVNYPCERISSLEVWGNKVKAILTDRSLVELDLTHRKPRWCFSSVQATLNIKKPTLRASYQYAGDICLGITEGKDIWIANGDQHIVIVFRDIIQDCAGATCLLLHGNLLAVGTEAARPMLKSNAVPSVFEWSKQRSGAALRRAERVSSRGRFRIQPDELVNVNNDDETGIVNDNVSEDDTTSNIDQDVECIQHDILSLEICVEIESATKDVGVQCELIKNVKNDSLEGDRENDSGLERPCQTKVTDLLENNDLDCDGSKKFEVKLRLACLKNNPVMMQHYTGFDDYNHFMFVFNLLGEEANSLKYYPSMLPAHHHHSLSPPDELFITVMKLRCNMANTDVAFLFSVSRSLVSNVFITWINFLYCQFKDLDIWAPKSIIESNLRFRGKNCSCTIILDCTEIKIDKPQNPEAQQLTYSSYKSANTRKVLIGISPSGAVTFISDAYGGAVSDREIFEKSGMLDLLHDGDTILCDRGFNVQDLVAHKNVTVNMPEFLQKDRPQFSSAQLRKSKSISSKRIHVERIIGLAKTYKMLNSKLTSALVPLGGRIIFVCFSLANFRTNIVL